ncbi:hypothetical protein [Acidovorax sp. MR-S7]|uniref:hypothetical protein n=1 Tax=Acidovorax sp. MR-S7 TaxID=1268622 RepID=UPI00035EC786|nr:hypothetical protein [Acidovorax sp. MR-S7]GAD21992.1 hypothetical protein AVS7_01752 [Acidovorax sp. MR-S7]
MGVPKGTDNFKSFRAAKQETSVALLRSELERAKRRKMPYPDKATLVSDMSSRTKIHRTTLVRNPLYHRLLLEFLVGQAGGSTFVADKDAPPELLRAKLIDAQMEIGSLKEQLAMRDRAASAAVLKVGRSPMLSESDAHSAYADIFSAKLIDDHGRVQDATCLDHCLQRCGMTPRSWTVSTASCPAGMFPNSALACSPPISGW